MPRLGVIDLGSNSVRLVIYEAKRSAHSAKPFRILVDEKKMAGLAAYVTDGIFTAAGIARAADILSDHLSIARNLSCDRVDIFATAVLRNCKNSAVAVASIEEAIEHPINLLSGAEEAALGLAGASIGRPLGRGALIDIGGGSTELTALADEGRAATAPGVSLPLGSVAAYAQFVRLVLPTLEECRAIAEAMQAQMGTIADMGPYRAERLYGIGGSVRAIVKMQAHTLAIPAKPAFVEKAALDRLFVLLQDDPATFAHNAVKAAPDRVHTLVPGMVIARTIMESLHAETIAVCKYGIREGYLMERMLERS